jgi:hypothetical protein
MDGESGQIEIVLSFQDAQSERSLFWRFEIASFEEMKKSEIEESDTHVVFR